MHNTLTLILQNIFWKDFVNNYNIIKTQWNIPTGKHKFNIYEDLKS